MINLIVGYFAGCFTMLMFARLLAHSTLQTHELKPIDVTRIDPEINPIARLHQLRLQSMILKDQLDAKAEEAVEIFFQNETPTEYERDTARSIVEHGAEVETVMDELC